MSSVFDIYIFFVVFVTLEPVIVLVDICVLDTLLINDL
jgi:hypothetical protein